MSKEQSKVHIGRAGVPMPCKAKICCPLASSLAHFEKVEQAQEFADKYNELYAKGLEYSGLSNDNIKELQDHELVYISDHIKEHSKENDNYNLYKGSIKWQKEVRSKSAREMIAIVNRNNQITNDLAKRIDDVKKKRRDYLKETDLMKRKSAMVEYRNARKELNDTWHANSKETLENRVKLNKLANKKEIAEEKILSMLEKQAYHSGVKYVEANVDAEIEERAILREESYSKLDNKSMEKLAKQFNAEIHYDGLGNSIFITKETKLKLSSKEKEFIERNKDNEEEIRIVSREVPDTWMPGYLEGNKDVYEYIEESLEKYTERYEEIATSEEHFKNYIGYGENIYNKDKGYAIIAP